MEILDNVALVGRMLNMFTRLRLESVESTVEMKIFFGESAELGENAIRMYVLFVHTAEN